MFMNLYAVDAKTINKCLAKYINKRFMLAMILSAAGLAMLKTKIDSNKNKIEKLEKEIKELKKHLEGE